MSLGSRLKDFRTIKHLTQADLAFSIGVTVTSLNRWENSATVPGYRNIATIANYLNISALDFLEESNTDTREITEIKKAYRLQKQLENAVSEVDRAEKELANRSGAGSQENYINAARNVDRIKTEMSFEAFDENTKTIVLDSINDSIKNLNFMGLLRLSKYIDNCLLDEDESVTDTYLELKKQKNQEDKT